MFLKIRISKIIPSFFTIKEGSTFLTKPLFPQGREDVTALRCSEPLRYKVGGPSKVFAILCGMGPPGEKTKYIERQSSMENHLIYYLATYTFSEIIAQATIFTVLVVVLYHFFEIFPCFHYQTVLITDAKVIYHIGTAIRANGDLLTDTTPTISNAINGKFNVVNR